MRVRCRTRSMLAAATIVAASLTVPFALAANRAPSTKADAQAPANRQLSALMHDMTKVMGEMTAEMKDGGMTAPMVGRMADRMGQMSNMMEQMSDMMGQMQGRMGQGMMGQGMMGQGMMMTPDMHARLQSMQQRMQQMMGWSSAKTNS